MATSSSILDWEIPWTEEPGRLYSSQGYKVSDMTEATQHAHNLVKLDRPELKSWLCLFLARRPWTSHLTALCFSLLGCKMQIIMMFSQQCFMRTGGHGTWKGLSKTPGTEEILGHSMFLAGTHDLCVCVCGFFQAPLTFSSPVATAEFSKFADNIECST